MNKIATQIADRVLQKCAGDTSGVPLLPGTDVSTTALAGGAVGAFQGALNKYLKGYASRRSMLGPALARGGLYAGLGGVGQALINKFRTRNAPAN